MSGSGKSVLAERAARRIGGDWVDLDAHFHLPGWERRPPEEFEAIIEHLTQEPRWTVSGGWAEGEHGFTARLTEDVWLDYPYPLVLARLALRTAHRVRSGEAVCNGNFETLATTFSRESPLLHSFRTYRKRREAARTALRTALRPVTILRHPREAELWLDRLPR